VSAASGARPTSPEHLVVGHITKAHGTKGELFVMPLTDRPDAVFAPGGELYLGNEEGSLADGADIVVIEGVRPFKRALLLKLQGVDDRDDAEPLAGSYFLLPVDVLPPLDEDEFFYHELLGLRVSTVDGTDVGTVREVFDTEPHHLLEVTGDDGKARLIPFAARIIHEVDRAGGRLVIDPPEGLLDI